MAFEKDFVVKNGIVVKNTATVQSIVNASSTQTGAMTIAGGLGVGATIYASDMYSANAKVLTTATLAGSGVTGIFAGTDTVVDANIGPVNIWNISTLQSVTSRGSSTNQVITLSNSSASTSTSTGALTVAGGVGIGGNLNVGGNSVVRGNQTVNGNIGLFGTATITGTVFASQIFDNNTRVISQILVGPGLSESTSTGPTITLTNTGVLSLVGGTDTTVSSTTGNVVIWNTATLQTITSRGSSTNQAVSFTNDTNSTSTTTGAVIIGGGLGVGQSIYATAVFDLGARVLTTSTIGSFGVSSLTAGTDTAVSTATGPVVVWNTSNLQSISSRGNSTNVALTITNTTQSVSTQSGALVVTGGAGIGGDLYATNVDVMSTTNATTSTNGALNVAGGAGIQKDLYVGGSAYIFGNAFVNGSQIVTTATAITISDATATNAGKVFGITTGSTATLSNLAIGWQALQLGTGTNNTVVGYRAMANNISGSTNTVIGTLALFSNTNGSQNVAIGHCALYNNNTGTTNIAIGACALAANTYGVQNIAIGTCALGSTWTGSNNIAVGHRALAVTTTGCSNIGIGTTALAANTSGNNNVALGFGALLVNTCGSNNVAGGFCALGANTSGANNVALGCLALGSNITGNCNIAIGFALLNS